MEYIDLASLKPNEFGQIREIVGGGAIRKRMYELGLNKGAKIKMVKNDFGPVILDISGSKLALGRGIALKIMVQR